MLTRISSNTFVIPRQSQIPYWTMSRQYVTTACNGCGNVKDSDVGDAEIRGIGRMDHRLKAQEGETAWDSLGNLTLLRWIDTIDIIES